MALGHLAVNVPDLVKAKAYYDQLMPALGFAPWVAADDEFAYRPSGGKVGTYLFFYPSTEDAEYSVERTGLQHLGFIVRTRAAVRDVHALVARLGSPVLFEPQEFPQYPPPYFATFWLDPFGFKLEAV